MPNLITVALPNAFDCRDDITVVGGTCLITLSLLDIGALEDYVN